MSTKLEIWNRALRALGRDRLATLTDNIDTRYELSDAWGPVVAEVSEAGLWNFSIVSEAAAEDEQAALIPGYTYTFPHPTGWVRTVQVSHSPGFDVQTDYRDEMNAIYTNIYPIYWKYVTSLRFGDLYLQHWPASFTAAVVARLALDLAGIFNESAQKIDRLEKGYKSALSRAKNSDAMNQAVMVSRGGSWLRAMQKRASGEGYTGAGGSYVGSIGDV